MFDGQWQAGSGPDQMSAPSGSPVALVEDVEASVFVPDASVLVTDASCPAGDASVISTEVPTAPLQPATVSRTSSAARFMAEV
jgi:hypothetical protein